MLDPIKEQVKEGTVEFFIQELATMNHQQDRINRATWERIKAIEERTKPKFEDDPTKLMGSALIFLVLLQLAPFVLEMVRDAWKSSSSSQLSV